jgi:excisionase family DNA binding protein
MDTTTQTPQWAFLTPQEVSDLLKVSVHTVRRWINDGSLPAYKVGRAWRIQQSELEGWISNQRPAMEAGG